MSVKTEKNTLVCSVRGTAVNVVRMGGKDPRSCEFYSASAGSSSLADLKDALSGLLKKHGLSGKFVVALPQKQCSCRFLKVPSIEEQEIERMVKMQASRLLPASKDELVVRFLVTSKEPDGYSNVTVIIVRREIVELYRELAEGAGVREYALTAGFNGLFNLYKKTVRVPGISAVVEINTSEAEVIFCSDTMLFFSRSFSLPRQGWQKTLEEEYRKTEEAFMKEHNFPPPARVFCCISPRLLKEAGAGLPDRFEAMKFWKDSEKPEEVAAKLEKFEFSFGSAWGAGLTAVAETADMVPDSIREARKTGAARKEAVNAAVFFLAAMLLSWAAIWQETRELERALSETKKKISFVEPEARKLEQFEKKLSAKNEDSNALEILRDIRTKASGIHLTSLVFEAGRELNLRGYAQEMQKIFLFASSLEASPALKGYKAAIKRTSEKKSGQGGAIEFEIICSKKK